jgi:class 3 adenylate cyclase
MTLAALTLSMAKFASLNTDADFVVIRVERSLYHRAVGYNYEAVKIFMPANRSKPVHAKYIEHVPPVRAGLELLAAVGGVKTHALLQTRVGIASGLVVVGDLIGSGASQEQAIIGETPNLAARLQGIAEPNSSWTCRSDAEVIG